MPEVYYSTVVNAKDSKLNKTARKSNIVSDLIEHTG